MNNTVNGTLNNTINNSINSTISNNTANINHTNTGTFHDYDNHDRENTFYETVQEGSIFTENSFNIARKSSIDQNISENDTSQKKNIHVSNKKITKIETLLKEAQDIIDNFILCDSKFEINIIDKTRKTIIYNFNEIKEIDIELQQDIRNKLKTIFDEVYTEIINILFLNSYTHYVLQKID